MLITLAKPSCSADLASFQLDKCCYKPEGVVFLPAALGKLPWQGKILREFSHPFQHYLMPSRKLTTLWKAYSFPSTKEHQQLFVGIKNTYKPVGSCTIARWLKETLRFAGVDVSVFSGYLVRQASVSAAAGVGVTKLTLCRQQTRVPSTLVPINKGLVTRNIILWFWPQKNAVTNQIRNNKNITKRT